jgi:glycosyltransferase involved in cell wall biosynthesis
MVAGWTGEILVVGAGPAEGTLRTLAETLNLKVSFLGHQEDPWSLVSTKDLYVSASAFEGEPLTLIEALQHDMPVIVSAIPAHVEILGNHSGLFANHTELAEKLRGYVQHSAGGVHRVAPALRNKILTERDPDLVAAKWDTLYRTVSKAGKRRGK